MGDMPKKYTKINGVMKLNPEYKRWKDAQNAASAGPAMPAPATTVLSSSQALPIVSSIEDHMQLNEDLGQDIPMAESTSATIDMLQEPEIAVEAGLPPDEMIDELGVLLAKYEIPIGLTNKLMMLSEFQSLEFIVDDSGSMQMATDSVDPGTRRPMSRWTEAHLRVKEMVEIIAYVPFEQIGIEFLNRKDRVSLKRDGRSPKQFILEANSAIDAVFARGPSGTTPALEKLQESFLRGQGFNIARYFFGDGLPNGGKQAVDNIIRLLRDRRDPEQNPMTFLSCTNEDSAVEWMKDAEEVALYCSESDDFNDEAREVLKDQGPALPYSKGFHLICQLVAAMCPEDLDSMDESVPFTKFTLDNILGIEHNEQSYRHYFDGFLKAQSSRRVEIDEETGFTSRMDSIRKNARWDYQTFYSTKGPATLIPEVKDFKRQLAQALN
mmetsp:Transcript_6698/g.16714  ORF Transcript_6698/g.16714 Transcript_6698/m.16714 type:complete len:438 (-) Transcript_6698:366-1679(-)